jgi:hypothetical protein
LAKALNERPKEGDDLGPVLGIQITGRLVGENDLGVMHNRSRNRHTLLLSAREFAGAMVSSYGHRD